MPLTPCMTSMPLTPYMCTHACTLAHVFTRSKAHIQQDGDDNVMLNKKLRETQRLLLEAYAESDMIRAEMVRACHVSFGAGLFLPSALLFACRTRVS